MTAFSLVGTPPPASRVRSRACGAAIVALGSAALLARPLLVRVADDPTAILVGLFVALGALGLWWPLRPPATQPGAIALPASAALAFGVSAFAVGRLLGPAGVLAAPAVAPVVLNTLAAVAEEAFFRRLAYGLLEPHGTVVAIVGSAACFAAVHVTVWGAAVLPLDLAAGLVLGWQRAVTGGWRASALTHVAANLLAVL